MNIHPRRVWTERGTYRRPSVHVTLVGEPIVPTAWALNTLAVRAPLNGRWQVGVAPDEAAAVAGWDRETWEHLLVWPAGQYLAWDAVLGAVADGASETRIGRATVLRREGGRSVRRDDLAHDGADAGHPQTGTDLASANPDLSVVVCVPSLGTCRIEWAAAIAELAAPVGCMAHLAYVEGFEVGEARQKLVDRVLAMRPRPAFLFFLGDDMLVPPGALRWLYDDLQGYPDIVAAGGIYYTKAAPPQVCAWDERRTLRPGTDFHEGDLLEVKSMGLDVCLMRTSWVDRLTRPMFLTEQAVARQSSEDAYFWLKGRRETGRGPWLDTRVAAGHIALDDGRVYP